MKEEIIITRDDLYAKVWSKPIIHLAKEYGISDVAVLKICKKLNVPCPDRGYWRKLEVGQKIEIKNLPQLRTGDPTEHRIQKTEPQESQKPKDPLPVDAKSLLEGVKNAPAIIVKHTLENPHLLVKQTAKDLKGAEEFSGYLLKHSDNVLDIYVGPAQLNRALCIMDALIKAIEQQNFKVCIKNGKTFAIVCGEEIPFKLKEKGTRRLLHTPYTRQALVPSGVLLLTFANDFYFGSSIKYNFSDNNSKKLEEQLNEFLEILIPVAYGHKDWLKGMEDLKRKNEEERKIREEQYWKAELEKRRATELEKTLELWQKSKNIRQLISEYEQAVNSAVNSISDEHKKEIQDWIKWVKQYADKIDPLKIVQILLKR